MEEMVEKYIAKRITVVELMTVILLFVGKGQCQLNSNCENIFNYILLDLFKNIDF